MKQGKKDKTEIFFNMIKTCQNKYDTTNIKLAMGVTGKDVDGIKIWCKEILENEELKSLDLDEIHYIMAVCAIKSKIKKESKGIDKDGNKQSEINNIPKNETRYKEKDTVTYVCRNTKCRKSFEIERSKLFSQLKKGVCQYCNYKYSIKC